MTRARDVATQGGLVLINTTTFTSASTIQIDNVFSSTYRNYRLVFNIPTKSANSTVTLQLSSGGTAASGNNYFDLHNVLTADPSNTYYYSGANYVSSWNLLYGSTALGLQGSIDITDPNLVSETVLLGLGFGYSSTYGSLAGYTYRGLNNSITSYDGLKFTITSGTASGVIEIYGYK